MSAHKDTQGPPVGRVVNRDELDRLEAEHQAAQADLDVAHQRVTAAATAIDEFWTQRHLAEAANGEVIAWL